CRSRFRKWINICRQNPENLHWRVLPQTGNTKGNMNLKKARCPAGLVLPGIFCVTWMPTMTKGWFQKKRLITGRTLISILAAQSMLPDIYYMFVSGQNFYMILDIFRNKNLRRN